VVSEGDKAGVELARFPVHLACKGGVKGEPYPPPLPELLGGGQPCLNGSQMGDAFDADHFQFAVVQRRWGKLWHGLVGPLRYGLERSRICWALLFLVLLPPALGSSVDNNTVVNMFGW
jgi:hypothetical protein